MNNEPYDPQNPDMPPLINDVIVDHKKFAAEAKEIDEAADKIGFTGRIKKITWPPK